MIYVGFLGAFLGGKILYCATELPQADWLYAVLPWSGGFSILGSIVGTLSMLLLYFSRTQQGMLANFDSIAPYVPLLQSIGRVGCFFAGCCYGTTCSRTWFIQYINQIPLIPFHIYRHPVQLYSALFLLCIFFYLFTKKNSTNLYDGQIALQYLIFASFERFTTDYWRGGRTFTWFGPVLSDNQGVAVILFSLSLVSYFIIIFYFKKQLKCF